MKSKLFLIVATGLLSTLTVAAEPDTQAIEYYHPELKHYFITASATDARFVDAGLAGVGWVRTGRSFGAWSKRDVAPANAAMVHRFYSPGANSHFYTASEDDIRVLRELEAKERAAIVGTNKSFSGWGYEGESFVAILPKNGQCPADTDAIVRTYNNGFVTGEGSNHRYLTDDFLKSSMEARKWITEGTVLCAPKASGASVSSSAAPVSGSFSGNVQFKFELAGQPEVKLRVPFSLGLAADGTVTGSGGGCNLTGTILANGTRIRNGTIIASGCTDARFNGTYNRVEIEQFSAKAIDIRFRQGDNTREVKIEGVVTTGSASTPISTPTTPTPPATDASGIAGEFAGMASWLITVRPAGQAETIAFNANQTLTLKITATGAVTGTGQGCTFSGTLIPAMDNHFTGSITATSCTEARLNGSYTATAHPEDDHRSSDLRKHDEAADSALEIELEREIEVGGVRTKVSIEGELARTDAVVTPPTPTSGLAIAGSFSGNASILATRRPSGGNEVTVVDKTQSLAITIGSAGAISGSGAGCSFSGSLASTNAALGIFGGTITAAGCSDSIVNGSYIATVTREDANAIEFELERETETNGERTKVKIKGRLNK